jgi:hypothetical protein
MVKSAPMIVVIFLLMFGKTEVAATLASTVKTVTFPILTAKDNNTHILLNETSMVPAKKMRKRKQNEANQTMKKVTVKRKKTNSSSASKRKCSIPKDTALPSKEQPKHSNKISLGGQEAATLRRIKREWKDAVKLGIAYDWIKMKDIANERDADAEYSYVRIGPYGSNLLRWHFSVMGTPNSEYDGGIYHGRVLLPKDYPGSPPRVQLLTPATTFA